MEISFNHIINPFPCPDNSEHGIASKITYASLERAVEVARSNNIYVDLTAVVLKGEESAIRPPTNLHAVLQRSVQDVKSLSPKRKFPLISDILNLGSGGTAGSYTIYTNMDISVQPNFYAELKRIILSELGVGVPFVVYRRNIPEHFSEVDELEAMYEQEGEISQGFDCFVFPTAYVPKLDLGGSCIGAAHFDFLLYMALDAVSGFKVGKIASPKLTFHIGNKIEWSSHVEYIEYNLAESLAAIDRMRLMYDVPTHSEFAGLERRHFIPNSSKWSKAARLLKRVPLINKGTLKIKRTLKRNY